MKKWTTCFAYVLIAAALSGCGSKGGEFVGKWQSTKYPQHQAVIEKNGDSYLLKNIAPSMFKRGETDTEVVPAVYKDGALEVSTGFGTAKVGYIKDTDTLLMPTMGGSLEYKRMK